MDSIWYILIAYICGSVITYVIMRGIIKHLRKCNAHLRNESDYNFKLVELRNLFVIDLPTEQINKMMKMQKNGIDKQYRANIERINRTGKY